MKKEIIRKKINKTFSKKELSEDEYKNFIVFLNKIKDEKPVLYNLNMGKIMLKKGDFTLAKPYFLKVLELNSDTVSANYNLYKISVEENNFQKAKFFIEKYEELLKNKNGKVNVSLAKKMLEVYLDIENDYDKFLEKQYIVSKSDLFGVVKITDFNLKNYYIELIESFNNKNFNNMKKIIYKMQEIIYENNVKIEVYTILEIVNKILEKEKNQIETNILSIINKTSSKQNSNKKVSIELISQSIYKILSTNLIKAQRFYLYMETFYNTELYKSELKCLKNMILEKEEYFNLSIENQKQYDDFKENGGILYREENLEAAYDYYLAGLYVTNSNIFNYYLGKIFYKDGNFDEAKEYLEKYIKLGGEKSGKALLYLSKIYKRRKKFKKAISTEDRISKLCKFFESDFKLRRKNFIKHEEKLKNIDFKEETENLSETKEQLNEIKKLILNFQDKKAEKLLNKLQQSDLSEIDKKLVSQFQKNKKLYRAKR